MLFAHSQGNSAMRRVAANLHLEQLFRRVDLRVAYDLVVVSVALLIGALLWLALARPMPMKLNRAFEIKNCGFEKQDARPCGSPILSH